MEIKPFVKLLSSIAKPEVRFLKKEELLFVQGDLANHICAVKEGCIKLVRYTIEGCSVTIHTAYAGESFAEAATQILGIRRVVFDRQNSQSSAIHD